MDVWTHRWIDDGWMDDRFVNEWMDEYIDMIHGFLYSTKLPAEMETFSKLAMLENIHIKMLV